MNRFSLAALHAAATALRAAPLLLMSVFSMPASAQAQAPSAVAPASAGAPASTAAQRAAGDAAVTAREPIAVTRDQLDQLLADLETGKEELAPMLEAIDVSAAEAWLASSPLASLQQRSADSTISEAGKAAWQTAIEHEQAGAERVRGPLDRAQMVLAAHEHLDSSAAKVREMLESMNAPRVFDEDGRTLSQLEEELAALNTRRSLVAADLETRREAIGRLEEQWRTQAETVAQMRRERDQQQAQPAPAVSGETAPELAEAQTAEREAFARRADARVIAAELDAQTLKPRIERLKLLIRQQELEDRWLDALRREAQVAVAQRSTEELRQLSSGIQRVIEREPDAEQRHAEQLVSMRRQIDEIADTQRRIRELQLAREDYLDVEADLAQTLQNVRERLEISGLNEMLGGLFLEEQRRLRALGELRFELIAVEQELTASRLETINLRERLRTLPEPAAVDESFGEESPQSALGRIQYQIATSLVLSEETLTDELRQTEARLRGVVAVLDELEQILRETLLWWPSHVPANLGWAARIPAATLALLDTRSWREIQSAFMEVTVSAPASTLLTLLIVAALYRAGRGTGPQLRALAEKTRHRFTDTIGLTFKALGSSLLRVLPAPVLLLSMSYRLQQIPETGRGVEILAAVLSSAAIWWLAGHLVLLFISRHGVGTVHFGWNPVMLKRLRRQLTWYLPTQFLLIVFLALAFGHPSELVYDVYGRAALVAASALTGFLAWRLLAPNPELTQDFSDRRRRLARLTLVTFAVVAIILSLAGYLLTVGELLERAIDTAVVVGLAWLCYRLAARALILSETRLRIRRMLEQRAKAAAAEASTPASEHTPDIPEPQLSMEDINQQTRTLVKVLAGGALVLALFWVWADILPALNWLDGVSLWSRSVTLDGAEVISQISLQDILLAVFLIALFTMGARNLPGLVEIILARSTQMDGAGRYTIATLLRYAILVVAAVSVFSLLGLRWSELQWLVAALTLGLGFGLQEVVANFVSGLIMLFERPVRVGDTITIGEYSGTVARIRTRATTIIDWDNREIVVPNKMFITERLINWTLSDTMTRIVLPVGVSYDSDPDLVIETLKRIAEEHPLTMTDPPPNALFLKLGDSALNFELRVYVKQMRDRNEAVSDLHRSIIRAFRELKIEIAFPQMDLHIRDVPRAAALSSGLPGSASPPQAPSPAASTPAMHAPPGSPVPASRTPVPAAG